MRSPLPLRFTWLLHGLTAVTAVAGAPAAAASAPATQPATLVVPALRELELRARLVRNPADGQTFRELQALLESQGRPAALEQLMAWKALASSAGSPTQRSAISAVTDAIATPELVATVVASSGVVTRSAPGALPSTLAPLETVAYWDRIELQAGSSLELLPEDGESAVPEAHTGPAVVVFDSTRTPRQVAAVPKAPAGPSGLIHLARDLIVRADEIGTGPLYALSPGRFNRRSRPALAWGLTTSPAESWRVEVHAEGKNWPPVVTAARAGLTVVPYSTGWPGLLPGKPVTLLVKLVAGSPNAADRVLAAVKVSAERSSTGRASPPPAGARTPLVAAWQRSRELLRDGFAAEALLELLPIRDRWPRTAQRRLHESVLAAELRVPPQLLTAPLAYR